MQTLLRRILLWWADIRLTPEELACRAWDRQGADGTLHEAYRHLFRTCHTITRMMAIQGRALAHRHRN